MIIPLFVTVLFFRLSKKASTRIAHVAAIATLISGLTALAITLMTLTITPITANAQSPTIQNDPEVFVNRLANGITYYAKQNPSPTGVVQIRIAFRAGKNLSADSIIAIRVAEAALGMGPPPGPVLTVDHDATVLSGATSSDSASVWNALRLMAQRIKTAPEDLSDKEIAYYKRRFRPDNMAIVVTGDITVKDAEAWLNYHFYDIPLPSTPLDTGQDEPKSADPSNHYSNTFKSLASPSQTSGSIDLIYRVAQPSGPIADRFKENLLSTFFTNILSQRIGELKGRPGSVITRGNAQYVTNTAEGNILQISVGFSNSAADSAPASAYQNLVAEIASVIENGISHEELVLWQEILRPNYASTEESPELNSAVAAEQYINHFLRGDIYATPNQEKPWVASIIEILTVDDLNRTAKRLLKGAQFELRGTFPADTGEALLAQYDSILAISMASLKSADKRPPNTNFQIVDLKMDGDRPFQELLIEEIKKGDDLGLTPVVEFGAIWCLPCRLVDVSLKHPKMQDAFKGVYLIRVDIEIWEDELQEAHFPIQSVPAFFATSLDGKPTGAVQFGANSGDLNSKAGELNNAFAENAAPGFKAFFAKCREEFLASKGGE